MPSYLYLYTVTSIYDVSMAQHLYLPQFIVTQSEVTLNVLSEYPNYYSNAFFTSILYRRTGRKDLHISNFLRIFWHLRTSLYGSFGRELSYIQVVLIKERTRSTNSTTNVRIATCHLYISRPIRNHLDKLNLGISKTFCYNRRNTKLQKLAAKAVGICD